MEPTNERSAERGHTYAWGSGLVTVLLVLILLAILL